MVKILQVCHIYEDFSLAALRRNVLNRSSSMTITMELLDELGSHHLPVPESLRQLTRAKSFADIFIFRI